MARVWGRRKPGSAYCWNVVLIIFAVVLFAGLLAVNIAGQGYERQPYQSPDFNQSDSSFPSNFLGGSLKEPPGCESQLIRQGDGRLSLGEQC